MNVDFVTKSDLDRFKNDLFEEIKRLLPNQNDTSKKWLKTSEVRKILDCSPGTLQNLRIKKIIEFTKIGGTIYYSSESINKALEQNKK